MRTLSTTDCRSLMLRAIVVRTFASSVEVFVQAQAEDHAGALRWTNDALFTLTCGPTSDAHRKLPRIIHAPGSGSCKGPSASPSAMLTPLSRPHVSTGGVRSACATAARGETRDARHAAARLQLSIPGAAI
jgi:acyl-CoA hydrolase